MFKFHDRTSSPLVLASLFRHGHQLIWFFLTPITLDSRTLVVLFILTHRSKVIMLSSIVKGLRSLSIYFLRGHAHFSILWSRLSSLPSSSSPWPSGQKLFLVISPFSLPYLWLRIPLTVNSIWLLGSRHIPRILWYLITSNLFNLRLLPGMSLCRRPIVIFLNCLLLLILISLPTIVMLLVRLFSVFVFKLVKEVIILLYRTSGRKRHVLFL